MAVDPNTTAHAVENGFGDTNWELTRTPMIVVVAIEPVGWDHNCFVANTSLELVARWVAAVYSVVAVTDSVFRELHYVGNFQILSVNQVADNSKRTAYDTSSELTRIPMIAVVAIEPGDWDHNCFRSYTLSDAVSDEHTVVVV